MIKLAYYPGCTAESICKELDTSTRAIAPLLGIDLIDIPWNCCGSGTAGEYGDDFLLGIHARVFALCEEVGADLVTVCNTCLVNLRKTNLAMKESPEKLARANAMLEGTGLEYKGTVDVKHLVWVIADDVGVTKLADTVKKPLHDLKVGPFYGCHMLRPTYALGWENAEEPRSLHSIIEALGADAVTYNGYNKCCGFHVLFARQKAANAMAGFRFMNAIDEGADLLVTPCPLCHVALDVYQRATEKQFGRDFDLPILHLPQLIGLAFGLTPKELGLERHMVSADIIEEKLGLTL